MALRNIQYFLDYEETNTIYSFGALWDNFYT